PARAAFAGLVQRRAALLAEKTALVVDEKTYAQQLDLLRFQAREIAEAQLQPDEQPQLEQEYRRAANVARLLGLSRESLGLLSQEEHSLLNQAGSLGRLLQELQRLDASAEPVALLHQQVVSALHELQRDLTRYADRVEPDPDRFRQLEARLDLIHSL